VITVYCDGLCEPVNPGGIACYGWVAYRGPQKLGEGCAEVARGPQATNNVAEYRALIAALRWLLTRGLTEEQVVTRSDSQLVVYQMQGRYAVKSPRVLPLHREAKKLARQFQSIRFEWVPRERNEEADLLSRRAYGEALARDRAARATGLTVQRLGEDQFDVGSSTGAGCYRVDLSVPECTCPDFARHRNIPGFACKHIAAARRASGLAS
jgi:ribonuclease HI